MWWRCMIFLILLSCFTSNVVMGAKNPGSVEGVKVDFNSSESKLSNAEVKDLVQVTLDYCRYANNRNFLKLNETIYPPLKTVQPGNGALYLWFHAENTTIKLKSLTFEDSFVNDFGVAKYKEVMASAEFETETNDLGYSIAYFKMKNGWKIVSFD